MVQLVCEQPDATLAELRDRLGITVSLWSICRALKQLKYTYKKSRSTPPSRTAPMSRNVGVLWRVSQAGIDPKKNIFIDETWAKTNMTRLRGRSLRGERLVAKVHHGHWKTTTLVAALDHTGMRCSMTIDGAVNANAFEAFVRKILLPTLGAGEIVVMDNLSSHKDKRVRELIESAKATLLYLPPYSPDLNPIEQAFAKLKQLMRSAGHRTMNALWSDVQRMLDCVSATDAINFINHCGYRYESR